MPMPNSNASCPSICQPEIAGGVEPPWHPSMMSENTSCASAGKRTGPPRWPTCGPPVVCPRCFRHAFPARRRAVAGQPGWDVPAPAAGYRRAWAVDDRRLFSAPSSASNAPSPSATAGLQRTAGCGTGGLSPARQRTAACRDKSPHAGRRRLIAASGVAIHRQLASFHRGPVAGARRWLCSVTWPLAVRTSRSPCRGGCSYGHHHRRRAAELTRFAARRRLPPKLSSPVGSVTPPRSAPTACSPSPAAGAGCCATSACIVPGAHPLLPRAFSAADGCRGLLGLAAFAPGHGGADAAAAPSAPGLSFSPWSVHRPDLLPRSTRIKISRPLPVHSFTPVASLTCHDAASGIARPLTCGSAWPPRRW